MGAWRHQRFSDAVSSACRALAWRNSPLVIPASRCGVYSADRLAHNSPVSPLFTDAVDSLGPYVSHSVRTTDHGQCTTRGSDTPPACFAQRKPHGQLIEDHCNAHNARAGQIQLSHNTGTAQTSTCANGGLSTRG